MLISLISVEQIFYNKNWEFLWVYHHTHTSHSLLPKSCKIVQEKHEIRKIELLLLQNESSKVKTNFHCVIAPRENQHFFFKSSLFIFGCYQRPFFVKLIFKVKHLPISKWPAWRWNLHCQMYSEPLGFTVQYFRTKSSEGTPVMGTFRTQWGYDVELRLNASRVLMHDADSGVTDASQSTVYCDCAPSSSFPSGRRWGWSWNQEDILSSSSSQCL